MDNPLKTTKDHALDGLFQGLLLTMIGGPIFIIGFVHGWLRALLYIAICSSIYFGAKYLMEHSKPSQKTQNTSPRSEVSWLGFIAGLVISLGVFFALF